MDDFRRVDFRCVDSRRVTTAVRVGPVVIGGVGEDGRPRPVVVQSMCDTDTCDVESSVAQIGRLRAAGCFLVRLTVQGMREVESMREISRRVRASWPDVALVADVHFQPAVALAVAEVVDKVRINPGNYERSGVVTDGASSVSNYAKVVTDGASSVSNYAKVVADGASSVSNYAKVVTDGGPAVPRSGAEGKADGGNYGEPSSGEFVTLLERCGQTGTAIRIGVNHGSLSERVTSVFGDGPEGMVASAMEFLRVCRARGFDAVVVSMKASDVRVMVAACRGLVAAMAAEGMQYPVHLGVTEAGSGLDGRVRSAVGIGALLVDGIGDTIRVSITEPPENEIDVARAVLQACGLDRSRAEVIACPGCGRTLYALQPVLEQVKAAVGHVPGLKIAVMGCIVNGPGEMADADYGYVGAGPGLVTLYRGREVVRRNVVQDQALAALVELLQEDGVWIPPTTG